MRLIPDPGGWRIEAVTLVTPVTALARVVSVTVCPGDKRPRVTEVS